MLLFFFKQPNDFQLSILDDHMWIYMAINPWCFSEIWYAAQFEPNSSVGSSVFSVASAAF